MRGYNYCQHQVVKGQGSAVWTTYVNHCTIVTKKRLKVLTSLDQNGEQPDNLLWAQDYTDNALPVDGWVLTRGLLFNRNLVSPYFSHANGKADRKGSRWE